MKSTCLSTLVIIGCASAQLVKVPSRIRNDKVETKSQEWGRRVVKAKIGNGPIRRRKLEASMSFSIITGDSSSGNALDGSMPMPEISPLSMPEISSMGVDMPTSDQEDSDNGDSAPAPAPGDHKDAMDDPQLLSAAGSLAVSGFLSVACIGAAYALV